MDDISIVEFEEFESERADGAGGDGGCDEERGGCEASGAHGLGLLPVSTTNEVLEIDMGHDETLVARGLGLGEFADALDDVRPAHVYAGAEIFEAEEHAEGVVMKGDQRAALHFF